ncbi:hypothetical protein WR25_18731 [Diploscapter pachys]|uniref:STAS domain-containing protein n=1 Tax=Diploscapter pachys TaxID=2018661 RepID=A0A2A2K3Z5_9BILA|nr:hypothetical protein WR25_18731 [Diploscapter pachys]
MSDEKRSSIKEKEKEQPKRMSIIEVAGGSEKNKRKDSIIEMSGRTRKPMNQLEFDKEFVYEKPEEEDEFAKVAKKFLRSYYEPFTSLPRFKVALFDWIPILKWLPQYNWKDDIIYDLMGGLTVGVMHVPQGIAYAMLAKQSAVVGLYTSLWPSLFYMFFGTSRHNSLGSFAVVSLMTGLAVSDMLERYPSLSPVLISTSLTLLIGIIELLLAFFKLSFLTTYFSDQVVSGFTTAASCHVFSSQLNDLFGYRSLPSRSGPFNLPLHLYDIVVSIPQLHVPTLCLSVSVMIFLIVTKDYVAPQMKKYISFPIPFELMVVILSTIVSYAFSLHENYGVRIVDHIPVGLPSMSVPSLGLFPKLITDALGIAIIVVAIHISLAKMFAKKLSYEVEAGQELFALGISTVGSSFFSVYPAAASLGRTIVNVETGTRTQSIWLMAFLSTLLINVTEGLIVSILYALFTTIAREQWPRWHLLGNVGGTEFRDSERYREVHFFSGVCIFRFDSPLLFTNVEKFKQSVNKAYREWEKSHEFYVLRKERSALLNWEEYENTLHHYMESHSHENGPSQADPDVMLSRHFIIDCSGFTFVDYMGVSALKEVYSDMRNRGILVYFAAAKAAVRDLFESSGFYSFVAKENFYPTIRDAVAIAKERQNELGQPQIKYEKEHDRLSEIISSQPMH